MSSAIEYIRSDYFRYTGKRSSLVKMFFYSLTNHCFRFCFWYRLSSMKNWMRPLARLIRASISSRYGILISRKTKIGYGLYIGHGYGIIVNSSAIIGNNCNLSQFVTIGSNEGQAAVIGDEVYIGPSVCLVEKVLVGNRATIGAGAVVTKDVPDDATVAGVPAKVLNYDAPARYIGNKWVID